MDKIFSFGNLFRTDVGAVAALGATVASLFDPIYLYYSLAAAVALDWMAGIRASKKDGTYASEYGIAGAQRTAVVLGLPWFCLLLDHAFRMPNLLFGAMAGALLYHTWQSFTANTARAGWEKFIPNWALAWVASELNNKVARSAQRQVAATGENKTEGEVK